MHSVCVLFQQLISVQFFSVAVTFILNFFYIWRFSGYVIYMYAYVVMIANNNNILLEFCTGKIAAIRMPDLCANSKIWDMEMNLFIKGQFFLIPNMLYYIVTHCLGVLNHHLHTFRVFCSVPVIISLKTP